MISRVKAAALGLALAVPAVANAQENPTFGDWVLICDTAQPCRLVQQQTLRETGALALRMIAIQTEEGAVLAAQVPMGAHLPSGTVYRLRSPEEEPQRQMIWQRCQQDVCEAAIQLSPEELELFGQTDAILVAYRMNPQDEPLIMEVKLEGFLDGLAQTGL